MQTLAASERQIVSLKGTVVIPRNMKRRKQCENNPAKKAPNTFHV